MAGEGAEEGGQGGEDHEDAAQQHGLVVRAERPDGEVLDGQGRQVDGRVADSDDGERRGPDDPGDELGDAEGDGSGDEPDEGPRPRGDR
ncbi:hypothetical protein [[Actinomadura] parvosata]|uniref:hypothetical protein n=1 Tax=[Actinomadura] parvosata TaxID=1955412 RepID=UPI001C911BF6|nr:hypothetical protein [Nonomuraea sp. ATCC 55076]